MAADRRRSSFQGTAFSELIMQCKSRGTKSCFLAIFFGILVPSFVTEFVTEFVTVLVTSRFYTACQLCASSAVRQLTRCYFVTEWIFFQLHFGLHFMVTEVSSRKQRGKSFFVTDVTNIYIYLI